MQVGLPHLKNKISHTKPKNQNVEETVRSLFQFFFSHLRSLVLDQCQHLFSTSLTLSLLLSL